MSIECKQSFTLGDVSSILQAHRGLWIVSLLQVNLMSKTLSKPLSEPMSTHISKTMNQTEARTKLLIISNENTRKAKQNKTQLEELLDGNRSHGKLQKQRSRSKSTCIIKGACHDRETSRLLCNDK